MKFSSKILTFTVLLALVLVGCHPKYAIYNNYVDKPGPIGGPRPPVYPTKPPKKSPVIIQPPIIVIVDKPVDIIHETPIRDNIGGGDRKYDDNKDEEKRNYDSKKHPTPLRDNIARR
ncbi:MAG: hypothetical protein JW866_08590 [Ignavibacteriales bacterium]|nr:hypothetical protein [Ignavibacteriales bacterium]